MSKSESLEGGGIKNNLQKLLLKNTNTFHSKLKEKNVHISHAVFPEELDFVSL